MNIESNHCICLINVKKLSVRIVVVKLVKMTETYSDDMNLAFEMEDEHETKMCTIPEIAEVANAVSLNSLPEKSKSRYLKVYKHFVDWASSKKAIEYTENVLLDYFAQKAQLHKASSLWSSYSMLKLTLQLYNNVDISQFSKLVSYLKRRSENYKPKKSLVLSKKEINEFLLNASNDKYLMMKVAVIFGIFGACRNIELIKLTTDDIEEIRSGSALVVTLRDWKNRTERCFTIEDDDTNSLSFVDMCKTYAALRPAHTEHKRFFIFYQNGRCSVQPVGKNKLAKVPYEVASFLKLPDAKLYTGRCFRRTSASILSHRGPDMLTIKKHVGWKSGMGNDSDTDEEDESDTDASTTTTMIKPSNGKTYTSKPSQLSVSEKRKQPYERIKTLSQNSRTDDEFSIFGEYISNKIRNLPNARLQAIAQHRINNILFELEMSHENEISQFSSASSSGIATPIDHFIAEPTTITPQFLPMDTDRDETGKMHFPDGTVKDEVLSDGECDEQQQPELVEITVKEEETAIGHHDGNATSCCWECSKCEFSSYSESILKDHQRKEHGCSKGQSQDTRKVTTVDTPLSQSDGEAGATPVGPPADVPAVVSRNRKGKPIRSDKKTEAYDEFLKHLDGGESKTESIKLAAEKTGISKRSLWDIITEKERPGNLSSPAKKRRRMSLDETQKETVQSIVHNFFATNESPTLDRVLRAVRDNGTVPPVSRDSLWKLLKSLGFKWSSKGGTKILLPPE